MVHPFTLIFLLIFFSEVINQELLCNHIYYQSIPVSLLEIDNSTLVERQFYKQCKDRWLYRVSLGSRRPYSVTISFFASRCW